MKIKGTNLETFYVVMEDNYLKAGETIQGDLGLMLIESVSNYNNMYNYKISYPAMEGEYLEIALKHFKFLIKYSQYFSLI